MSQGRIVDGKAYFETKQWTVFFWRDLNKIWSNRDALVLIQTLSRCVFLSNPIPSLLSSFQQVLLVISPSSFYDRLQIACPDNQLTVNISLKDSQAILIKRLTFWHWISINQIDCKRCSMKCVFAFAYTAVCTREIKIHFVLPIIWLPALQMHQTGSRDASDAFPIIKHYIWIRNSLCDETQNSLH